MPIQINEIVFKATIQDNKDSKGGGAASGGVSEEDKQKIIEACIEQMIEMDRRNKDR